MTCLSSWPSLLLLILCWVYATSPNANAELDRRRNLASKSLYKAPDQAFKLSSPLPATCSAKQINFVCRHGTRQPTRKRIYQMQRLAEKLAQRISSINADAIAPEYEWLAHWKPLFDPSIEGQLTRTGIEELVQMGKRMVQSFPEPLGRYQPNTMRIRSTSHIRAGQSATAFAFGAWNMNMTTLSAENFTPPFVTTTGPLNNDPILRFFDMCPAYSVSKDDVLIAGKKQQLLQRVAPTLTKKLNHKIGADVFLPEHIESLWLACQSELSVRNDSGMCSLFDDDDFATMQLAEDIAFYWMKGYGVPINYLMSCPLLHDIVDSIKTQKYVSDLRFAHAETVVPLLAILGLHHDHFPLDANLTPEQARHRLWQTRNISPFATNLAFVVYQCERNDSFVAVFHNEAPVKVPLCKGLELCPVETILSVLQSHFALQHRRSGSSGCRLSAVCQVGDGESSQSSDIIIRLVVGLGIGLITSIVATKIFRSTQYMQVEQ